MKMKLVKGLVLRQISPKSFVLENTDTDVLGHKMITFNSTAAFLWNSIGDKDFTKDDIAELLVKKYSISLDSALEDSDSIIRAWLQAAIVECQ